MKTLVELEAGECRYALTDPPADQSWSHLRLGDSGPGLRTKTGALVGSAAAQHFFCGAPATTYTDDKGRSLQSSYCAAHHELCYRGPGKDARSLEEMIYATDQSQYRGNVGYAEHTDPMDVELARERPVSTPDRSPALASLRRRSAVAGRIL